MAGPGIRYWEFARILGNHFTVRLIVPPFIASKATTVVHHPKAELYFCQTLAEFREIVGDCQIIITLGINLYLYPFLANLNKPLVLDLYNPVLLELLQQLQKEDHIPSRLISFENFLDVMKVQLLAGDFFICAGEKQRDYWFGVLSAVGRINPQTHQDDPTLYRLIDVVPFGLPDDPPEHTDKVLKGVYKTISEDDKVILWGGGIWNWLDAPTLIEAMPIVLEHRQDVKLFFMGIKRPNADVVGTEAIDQTIARTRDLGLLDEYIFFNDWVPYEQRQNYLLEADIGISLHLDHAETRFSFRTRLMDYLWAGLPIVTTKGDVLGETLAAQNLARLVEPGNPNSVADAILAVLNDSELKQNRATHFQRVASQYCWEVVTQPLVDFCANPYFSADKDYINQAFFASLRKRGLISKVFRTLRVGGVPELFKQGVQYIKWQMRR